MIFPTELKKKKKKSQDYRMTEEPKEPKRSRASKAELEASQHLTASMPCTQQEYLQLLGTGVKADPQISGTKQTAQK